MSCLIVTLTFKQSITLSSYHTSVTIHSLYQHVTIHPLSITFFKKILSCHVMFMMRWIITNCLYKVSNTSFKDKMCLFEWDALLLINIPYDTWVCTHEFSFQAHVNLEIPSPSPLQDHFMDHKLCTLIEFPRSLPTPIIILSPKFFLVHKH